MSEPIIEIVILSSPITRGEKSITEIKVQKPTAGQLRGVSLTSLLQMEVTDLCKVLPRITQPSLTDDEINRLDIADLTKIGAEVVGFLLPKEAATGFLTA